ncbi:hypothetical protein [Sphingomonas sp. SUN039]|uniref:hypothetical protein n=1 Tax=Sphingomonas sp. SUN039 TaxID=2937787 RepID=UPI002164BE3B|nr:hypothetical protein [Sphingomonas sp. SUN039]UVO53796.1 hypothetical protein M0209_06555 [Sphingomonas sp. SUN039]
MATAAPLQRVKRSCPVVLGDLLYVSLAFLGWLATTLLAAAGCFVVLFALAGNGSVGGFFAQVERLAWHYLAADGPRRAAFDGQLFVIVLIILFATGFFRRASLISIFKTGGVDGSRHADHS